MQLPHKIICISKTLSERPCTWGGGGASLWSRAMHDAVRSNALGQLKAPTCTLLVPPQKGHCMIYAPVLVTWMESVCALGHLTDPDVKYENESLLLNWFTRLSVYLGAQRAAAGQIYIHTERVFLRSCLHVELQHGGTCLTHIHRLSSGNRLCLCLFKQAACVYVCVFERQRRWRRDGNRKWKVNNHMQCCFKLLITPLKRCCCCCCCFQRLKNEYDPSAGLSSWKRWQWQSIITTRRRNFVRMCEVVCTLSAFSVESLPSMRCHVELHTTTCGDYLK